LQDHIPGGENDFLADDTIWRKRHRQEEFKLQIATKGLVQCLLDASNPITGYVRRFEIGPLRQDHFESKLALILEGKLKCLVNLQSLR
jgi:hypothetical protein